MHDAVMSKLVAASRGSPCDSMASCLYSRRSHPDVSCIVDAQFDGTKQLQVWHCGLPLSIFIARCTALKAYIDSFFDHAV